MSIVRVKKDARYFSASNEPFNDKRLSWETRGLMGYLLSKPNNWQVRMDGLEKAGPAGNHKLRRMLAEARQYGYMNRIRITLPGNKFDWITEVYESPSLNPNPTASYRKSTSGFSTSGKPPDIVITEGVSTESFNLEGDATEAEVERMKYDLIAMNFNKNIRPYLDEFYRLTKILPEGKAKIEEWKKKCANLYGAKLLVTDMESALNKYLEGDAPLKDPGTIMTNMQTIKMRRELNVQPKQNGAKHATTPNRQPNAAIDPEQLERDRATAERIKARRAAQQARV